MNADSPFAFRDYRLFLAARVTVQSASVISVVVVGWQVYDIARRTMSTSDAALMLGLIGLAQFLPLLLLTLIVGYVADRIDRRKIAAAAVAVEALCILLLLVQTSRDTLTLPQLFAISALLGVGKAFASPAVQALGPTLVPPKILPKAIAYNALSWQFAVIIAPPLGGYLYAANASLPYGMCLSLLLLSFVTLLSIRPAARPARSSEARPLQEVVEGLRYVARNRMVLGAISLDLFAVLLGGATAMLPIFARDILHVGPEGLGELRAAPAIGAALMGLALARRPARDHVGAKMLAGVALFGLATVVFGLSRNMWLSLAALAVLGAADMFSVYVRQTLEQIYTPDAMRGRVGAVSNLFVSASNELGEFESGILAALITPVGAVVLGGIGAILVTALWTKLFPELRRVHNFDVPPYLSADHSASATTS